MMVYNDSRTGILIDININDGSFLISCINKGHYFKKRYFGYTRTEALKLFKRELKNNDY